AGKGYSDRWSAVGCNPPDGIGQVVGNDQRPCRVDSHTHRAAPGLAVLAAEVVHEVNRIAGRPAVADGYEDHLVTHRLLAVPAAMLTDKGAVGKVGAHFRDREIQAERRHVGTQAVVRSNRGGDLVRVL